MDRFKLGNEDIGDDDGAKDLQGLYRRMVAGWRHHNGVKDPGRKSGSVSTVRTGKRGMYRVQGIKLYGGWLEVR